MIAVAPRTWRTQVATLGYHDVSDIPAESGFQHKGVRRYRLNRRIFQQHLDQIGTAPCQPKLVTEIDLTQSARHLMMTFDDGGKSALHIGDELCRRGWRGHFFIPTNRIGQRTFLNSRELRYLRECGHLLGTHSHTHPSFCGDLTWERMLVEWHQSADVLAQLLGVPCRAGAVPARGAPGMVVRSAATAGLRYLFTSEPRLHPPTRSGVLDPRPVQSQMVDNARRGRRAGAVSRLGRQTPDARPLVPRRSRGSSASPVLRRARCWRLAGGDLNNAAPADIDRGKRCLPYRARALPLGLCLDRGRDGKWLVC